MTLTQDTQEKLILYGAVGIALYYAFKRATNFVEPVSNVIADAIIGMTLPGNVQVLGVIVLPNGNQIPVNGLAIDSKAQFTYQGIRYTLTGRDSYNRYVAVKS